MFFHIYMVKILSHPSHITPVKIPLSFTVRENIYKLSKELITVEPGYNKPLYNEALVITNNNFLCSNNYSTIVKLMKENLDIMKPHCRKLNFAFSWPLILLGFHSSKSGIQHSIIAYMLTLLDTAVIPPPPPPLSSTGHHTSQINHLLSFSVPWFEI